MQWDTDISFCPNIGALSSKAVAALIGKKVLASNVTLRNLLEERYDRMSRNFRATPHTGEEWKQIIGGSNCLNKQDKAKPDARLIVPVRHIATADTRISAYSGEPNFGLDLPTWFCRKGAKKPKRIMLVSQDPLRDNDDAGSLFVSSPWAFHSREFRDKERKKIPQLLVNHLLAQWYCVYLTDASKLFVRNHAFCRDVVIPAFCQSFQDVLRQEIMMFKPNVIVAVGQVAAQILTASECNRWTSLTLPEPSKALVAVSKKNDMCILTYHYSKLSAHKKKLASHYKFADNAGNFNYLQYYMRAIEAT